MRIISGLAGGIRLRAPHGDAVRPTTDRVKESVFASLEPISGLRVVDLFSGTGALGLEALSRGAAAVALVERDRRALACLRENAAAVCRSIGPSGGELRLVPADVASLPQALADWAGSVDIILADPPYHPEPRAYGAAALLCDPEFADWASGALLVLEHAVDSPLPWHPEGLWRPHLCKRYGALAVAFARRVGKAPG
jgi:16S rRNA (guanine966-N2)-methyltransferase